MPTPPFFHRGSRRGLAPARGPFQHLGCGVLLEIPQAYGRVVTGRRAWSAVGHKGTALTAPSCRPSFPLGTSAARSQSATVRSSPPVASALLSGENASVRSGPGPPRAPAQHSCDRPRSARSARVVARGRGQRCRHWDSKPLPPGGPRWRTVIRAHVGSNVLDEDGGRRRTGGYLLPSGLKAIVRVSALRPRPRRISDPVPMSHRTDPPAAAAPPEDLAVRRYRGGKAPARHSRRACARSRHQGGLTFVPCDPSNPRTPTHRPAESARRSPVLHAPQGP